MPYTVLSIKDTATGQDFVALAPEGEIWQDADGDRGNGPLLIFGGPSWAYLIGKKPIVGTNVAVITPSGTTLIVHGIPASGGNARTRVIVLEGSGPTDVSLNGGGGSQSLAAGNYLDVWLSTPPTLGNPAVFLPTNPDSAATLSAVATACAAEGIAWPLA